MNDSTEKRDSVEMFPIECPIRLHDGRPAHLVFKVGFQPDAPVGFAENIEEYIETAYEHIEQFAIEQRATSIEIIEYALNCLSHPSLIIGDLHIRETSPTEDSMDFLIANISAALNVNPPKGGKRARVRSAIERYVNTQIESMALGMKRVGDGWVMKVTKGKS